MTVAYFSDGTGPNDHTIAQIKDAVRDGLRAVKNTIEDGSVVLVSFFFFLITTVTFLILVTKHQCQQYLTVLY